MLETLDIQAFYSNIDNKCNQVSPPLPVPRREEMEALLMQYLFRNFLQALANEQYLESLVGRTKKTIDVNFVRYRLAHGLSSFFDKVNEFLFLSSICKMS